MGGSSRVLITFFGLVEIGEFKTITKNFKSMVGFLLKICSLFLIFDSRFKQSLFYILHIMNNNSVISCFRKYTQLVGLFECYNQWRN